MLLFVNDVDAAYRLRLLLEAFGLRAAVLFGGLPLNSRHHVIQQFNKDLFDYLIAADSPEKPAPTGAGAKAKRRRAAAAAADEAEFGVTRGVDFQGVRTVVNVDMPCGAAAYTHRVGRTGRAGAAGVAVSLVAPADAAVRDEVAASLQVCYLATLWALLLHSCVVQVHVSRRVPGQLCTCVAAVHGCTARVALRSRTRQLLLPLPWSCIES